MSREKNRIIVVEGPQGSGKSTLVEYLRTNIAASNLYRLSGQRDKTASGKQLSTYMYTILQDYIEKMSIIPMDLIFDRTFFTEEVYARIGFKEYSFTDVYEQLVDRLIHSNYDIHLIILYLENTNLYAERLNRVHHNYQAFSLQGSINQQNTYLQMAEELKHSGIHIHMIAMDDFEKGYQEINEIFNIHNEKFKEKTLGK